METDTELHIPYLAGFDNTIEAISKILDGYDRRSIKYALWSDGSKLPEASFVLAYDGNNFFLKYYVIEHTLKAVYDKINDPVYEDSCVEFFIAFDDDINYYNLEFNCTGTCRAQYGQHKNERLFLPVNLLKTIRHQTLIKNGTIGQVEWELTLWISGKIFKFHPELPLGQTRARVNFYKCGDGLPEPHFLCWNKIEAEKPEFHLSKFFREVTFSPQAYS